MKFQKLSDNGRVEISSYLKEYIIDHKFNNLRIYVGCDSHNKGEFTTYVTTVVIHIGDTGCHVLFQKEKIKRINDLWSRLWNEVEKSVQLALYLRENGINIHNIDLDLNDDEQYASNKLVSAATGYVHSLGIKPRIKPDLLPAVSAADNLSKSI
jgi:predicted RNase H-related nuclease YkuK (DUF458 family)